MGLLTRTLRRGFLRVLSVVFCTPELLPAKSERFLYSSQSIRQKSMQQQQFNNSHRGELTSVAEEGGTDDGEEETMDGQAIYMIRGLVWTSAIFDILDLVNAILDIVFAVRLARLNDSTVYAIIVILGVVLGRIVLFRGTWLLFHGGIQIDQSLQDILHARSPFNNKNIVALQLLYCLAYSEAAAFLLENYPSLATYAFWRTINSPSAPLEQFDKVNVIMSVVLCLTILFALVTTTFTVTVWRGYLRLKLTADTWQQKLYHIGTMVLGSLLGAATITFLWQIISLAWRVTIFDRRELPSGTLLWGAISLCDDVDSLTDRLSFCDERAFLIKTALAWLLASYFAYFLFYRPAGFGIDFSSDADGHNRGFALQYSRKQKDDTQQESTSNSGADWTKEGDVEIGKTVCVTAKNVPKPLTPRPRQQDPKISKPSQHEATKKLVRANPRNSESGATPAHSPYRPSTGQAPTVTTTRHAPLREPLEDLQPWTVPQTPHTTPQTTPQVSQAHLVRQKERASQQRSETKQFPKSRRRHDIDPSQPRAPPTKEHDGTRKPNNVPGPKQKSAKAIKTLPPDPFASMQEFEAVVLMAAETVDTKKKKKATKADSVDV